MVKQLYFVNMSGESGKPAQATPLKIHAGDYIISLAGDNSCGSLKEKCSRLDIVIFDKYDRDVIEQDIWISTFDELVEIVKKWEALSESNQS